MYFQSCANNYSNCSSKLNHGFLIQFRHIRKISFLFHISEEDLTEFCKENDWHADGENIFIRNQDAHVKSKNISEKITFDSKSFCSTVCLQCACLLNIEIHFF